MRWNFEQEFRDAKARRDELKQEVRRLNRFLGGFSYGDPGGYAVKLAFCPRCLSVGERRAFRQAWAGGPCVCARCARSLEGGSRGHA